MRVVIVGAGFGGIAAAIELRRHGITDVTILDAAPGIGGTWLHNTYPGAACDVPSQLYSYSYEQRKDWPQLCSPQSEILDYIHDVARKHGVADLVEADTRVERCAFDDATAHLERRGRGRPDVGGRRGRHRHRPAAPAGLAEAAGHRVLRGPARSTRPRGTTTTTCAASASPSSGRARPPSSSSPRSRPRWRKLSVFQRTGNWFYPASNRAYPPWFKRAIRWIPGLQLFRRGFMFVYTESLTQMIRHPSTIGRLGALRASLFMRWQLRGHPEVRKKVWPHYTFGCKRVLFSSHWLPALTRPNVEVVDQAIDGVDATGISPPTAATTTPTASSGAPASRPSASCSRWRSRAPAARSLEQDAWADGPHAHLGMAVPGFPSLFIMYGPNTNTSGGSIIWYLEQQAAYIRQALVARAHAGRRRGRRCAPTSRPRSTARSRAPSPGTAWTQCDSWYRDESGRITTNWPWSMREYHRRVAQFDPAEYELVARARQSVGSAV